VDKGDVNLRGIMACAIDTAPSDGVWKCEPRPRLQSLYEALRVKIVGGAAKKKEN
jgi:hypothetical protein